MNVERLKHLITILSAVPPEHFDLGYWDCGTTACAVGWACRDEQFNKQGLTVGAADTYREVPRFSGLARWDAVEAFFDLDYDQAQHLFSLGYYDVDPRPTPDDVIARIEAMLREAGHDA